MLKLFCNWSFWTCLEKIQGQSYDLFRSSTSLAISKEILMSFHKKEQFLLRNKEPSGFSHACVWPDAAFFVSRLHHAIECT